MTHHDSASLQQATVVSYSAQMLSFGRIITAVPVAFRLPTVPVHCYQPAGARTLLADNHRSALIAILKAAVGSIS